MLELRECVNWALPVKHAEHSVLYHMSERCVSAGNRPKRITQLVYRSRHIQRFWFAFGGVERVVYHWCHPRENFLTPLFLAAAFRSPKVYPASDWRVVCRLLPDTKCSITPKGFQGAYKSLIDIQSACKQVKNYSNLKSDLCLHHCGYGVWPAYTHLRSAGVGFVACNLLLSTTVTQRATLWALSKNADVIVYVFMPFTLSRAVSRTACSCFRNKGTRSGRVKTSQQTLFLPSGQITIIFLLFRLRAQHISEHREAIRTCKYQRLCPFGQWTLCTSSQVLLKCDWLPTTTSVLNLIKRLRHL